LKDGANPKLATEAWVTNHYKWLIWKHASFARRFSQGKHLWCFDEILNSIKYRYEVEFSHMKRSCLKLIAEGDDSAAKHMVLCVSRLEIYEGRVSLELTDGWYCMNAEIDKFLTTLVIEGRIVLGMKLHVQNAHVSRFYLDDRQFFSMRDFGIAQRFKAGHLRQWYEDIEPG
jgi:breast cancer 2 susceptibility protein